MQEIIVTVREEGQRLVNFLEKYLDKAPKSFFYKMMRKKNIVLNEKKAAGNERLQAEDRIQLYLSDQTLEGFRTEKKEDVVFEKRTFPKEFRGISVIYEDEEILLVNKPVGVLSQKAGREDVSLVEWIQEHLMQEMGSQNVFRPGICNRLDRNTTGLVAAGKTVRSLQYLNRLFRERELKKYYLCLTEGRITKKERLDGYLKKSERGNIVTVRKEKTRDSVRIETEYEPKEHFAWKGKSYTLLQVHLITGKPHQIRAHLASIGSPVVGDWKYGEKKSAQFFKKEFGISEQLLHAWKLIFNSPDYLPEKYHGMEWTAPLPEKFETVLGAMRGKA